MNQQPSHTVYGGAHLFKPGLAEKMTRIALETMESFQGQQLPWDSQVWQTVLQRASSPKGLVEDIRIDFEDGYGQRSDDEEDGHAQQAGRLLAEYLASGLYQGRLGLRIKDLWDHHQRSWRTLRLFTEALGGWNQPAILTIPKVADPKTVERLVSQLENLDPAGFLSLELMVESPRGLHQLGESCRAAGSRLRAIHFGPFDFLAQCGVLGGDLHHPLAARAKQDILLAVRGQIEPLLGRSLEIADGPTTLLPVRAHREVLSTDQQRDNDQALATAWSQHRTNIQLSLQSGFPQSWILHPAQLVSLHCTLVECYLRDLDRTLARLQKFQEAAQQATRSSQEFDDLATVRVLVNHLRRAHSYGLVDQATASALLAHFSHL